MKNVLFHAPSGAKTGLKAAELCKLLAEKAQNCFVTAADICQNDSNPNSGNPCKVSTNLTEEDIDSLIVAFPDPINTNNPNEITDKVLTESFKVIKNFVQVRMKKKFGQILCLIDARANGMPYGPTPQPLSPPNRNELPLPPTGGLDSGSTIESPLACQTAERQDALKANARAFNQELHLQGEGVGGEVTSKAGEVIFLAAQGGLIGLSKTVAKEYSKRGIMNNVLYIDWHAVPLSEVAARVDSLLIDSLFNSNTNLNGQVIALDGGKWL
ncbi:MAG: hypothetical protein SFU25_06280 [Candidatus Caenarcaniphilales bacterium]|nr:hypothetical protein [Candidatus Caenarcaniphilales bacterium]